MPSVKYAPHLSQVISVSAWAASQKSVYLPGSHATRQGQRTQMERHGL
jgi:hypothetical protein